MQRACVVYPASFVAALLLGLLSGPKPAIASPRDATGQRPNILLITSEDNGAHLGCYGDKNVATPNLDKLAAEGVRFENVYVSTRPVPLPSLPSTGRPTVYRNGSIVNSARNILPRIAL